jgi:hypothetical protein
MTPREWAAWMDGFALKEQDEWRRLRLIYALIYNTHVEARHQMKPEELIPLPGDTVEEVNVKVLTDMERAELANRYGFNLAD